MRSTADSLPAVIQMMPSGNACCTTSSWQSACAITVVLRLEVKGEVCSWFGEDWDDPLAFAQGPKLLGSANIGLEGARRKDREGDITSVNCLLDVFRPDRSTGDARLVQPRF